MNFRFKLPRNILKKLLLVITLLAIAIFVSITVFIKYLNFSASCDLKRDLPDLVDAKITFLEPLNISLRRSGYNLDKYKTISSFKWASPHYSFTELPPNQKFEVIGCGETSILAHMKVILKDNSGEKYWITLGELEYFEKIIENNKYQDLYASIKDLNLSLFEDLLNTLQFSKHGYLERRIGKLIFQVNDVEKRELMLKMFKQKIYHDPKRVVTRNQDISIYERKIFKSYELRYYHKNLVPCYLIGWHSCSNDITTSREIDRSLESSSFSTGPLDKFIIASNIRAEIVPTGTVFRVVEKFTVSNIKNNFQDHDSYLVLEDENKIKSEIREDSLKYHFEGKPHPAGASYEKKLLSAVDELKVKGALSVVQCLKDDKKVMFNQRITHMVRDLGLEKELELSFSKCSTLKFTTIDAFATFILFSQDWWIDFQL